MNLGAITNSFFSPRAIRAACGAALALLLPVLSGGPTLASEPSVSPSPAPRIEFPVPKHDFGSVPKGQAVLFNFKVLNTGNAPLEISAVQPACGCTTTREWTHHIEPGASGVIPIKLETAQFTGPVTKTITITSNDPARRTTVLEINGTIWTPILISQPVVIFPAQTQLDQRVSRTISLRNQVEGSLRLTDLQSDKPMFQPVLKEIVPGREFELTITTVPPLRDGTATARITMKSSNPSMPEIAVQAVVTVLPAVQIAPSEIVLATIKLVAAEKKYVVVLNHRGGNLKLSDLKTNVDGVQISTATSSEGKQSTITLTFPAGFEISPGTKMRFSGKTNHPDFPAFEVPIVYAGNR